MRVTPAITNTPHWQLTSWDFGQPCQRREGEGLASPDLAVNWVQPRRHNPDQHPPCHRLWLAPPLLPAMAMAGQCWATEVLCLLRCVDCCVGAMSKVCFVTSTPSYNK